MATSALSLSHIDAYYGDSHVLANVSFELGEARMLGLLGRNGAGKSTCMNVTMGLLPPRRGEVVVFGEQGDRPVARDGRGAGRGAGAAGPPHLQEPDRARKPHGRRAQAGCRQQARAVDRRHRVRDVSAPARAAQADRRASVRRRAADAGDRPRA